MALNITNRKVEEKAISASKLLGINKTAAVEIALDFYLKHHGSNETTKSARLETARIFDEMVALPVMDDRDPDEILGYDKDGLL
jgi:antitoxin VapB